MKYLYLVLICLLGVPSMAQDAAPPVPPAPKKAYVWGELGISASAYKGELSPAYRSFVPVYHAGFMRYRQRRLNGSFLASAGAVTGSNLTPSLRNDLEGVSPNRFVRTSFFSLQYGLQFNLIRKERFRLYLSQGVGVIRFSPRNEDGQLLADIPSTRMAGESYGRAAIMLPTQAGMQYFFGNQFGLGFSAGWLNTFTPYLDNIYEASTTDRNDNILSYRFSLLVPLRYH
jgi:hypothetical protein